MHGALYDSTASDFDALLAAAVDAIVVIDTEGRIRAFNPAAERMFEYTADELLGQPVTRLMPAPYRDEHDAYVARYLAHGEPRIIGKGREVEAVSKSGSVFPVWLAVGEALSAGGRRFVGIIRDLSDEKAAELERRALEGRLADVGRFSLMGEMAAGIAHEINQPLGAISNYAQAVKGMLERGVLDESTLKQAVEAITQQTERAAAVIENLRGFIRQQDADTEPCELNAVIGDVLPLVRTDAASAGVTVRLDLAEALPTVDANAVQLQQILLNLTRNAVDAMADSPSADRSLVIQSRSVDEGWVEFGVADRGPGVPPRLAEGIFHPFVTTKRDGLGVGLAISRTIARAHGGRLECAPNPGGGAVFTAVLPTRQDKQASNTEAAADE